MTPLIPARRSSYPVRFWSSGIFSEWLIKLADRNWHSGNLLMEIIVISHYTSSWYRLKNVQVLYIYIYFICTSENIPQYHRLKSCNIVCFWEREKGKYWWNWNWHVYLHYWHLNTQEWFSLFGAHTTQTKPQSIYIFIYLVLASSNLNSTTSTQHSEALCHEQPC